ncbi:hypothetical protein IOD16_37100 [Saccharothrix sp. 6-C]|uniref:hypothetical protein n=1 Tax=Saccharothrix sp. 6-C TaxID=2781735 RepID=UPI001917151C|nr:hypothetical protein [Saccharothrix sp. 6-C]QQQ76551.1 hypothetical protein IOD16_37100 [Saccharothrix sp. 6-C]
MKVMGVVLAVAGLALVGCTGEPAASSGPSSTSSAATAPSTSSVAPTAVTVQSTVTSTVVETVVVDTTPVLSHTGFGAIELGMTREELVATGLVGEPVSRMSAQCDVYEFKSGSGTAWVQGGEGVMAIIVKYGATTAEGLPVDISPVDPRVARTYPGGEAGPNGYAVRVEDGVSYLLHGATALTRRGQACFN